MARRAVDLPDDPAIVVTNPDDDCSPAALKRFFDEVFEGPEPDLERIGAAEYIRKLRDGEIDE